MHILDTNSKFYYFLIFNNPPFSTGTLKAFNALLANIKYLSSPVMVYAKYNVFKHPA